MPGDSERTQPPTEGGSSRPVQKSDETTRETMRRTAEHVHDQLDGPDDEPEVTPATPATRAARLPRQTWRSSSRPSRNGSAVPLTAYDWPPLSCCS